MEVLPDGAPDRAGDPHEVVEAAEPFFNGCFDEVGKISSPDPARTRSLARNSMVSTWFFTTRPRNPRSPTRMFAPLPRRKVGIPNSLLRLRT